MIELSTPTKAQKSTEVPIDMTMFSMTIGFRVSPQKYIRPPKNRSVTTIHNTTSIVEIQSAVIISITIRIVPIESTNVSIVTLSNVKYCS